MGKNKKEKPELTLENLNRAIRTYQREEVLYLIQHGILKDIPEDEKTATYQQLVSLQNMEILQSVARQENFLDPEIFCNQSDSSQSKVFVNQCLTKFRKQFLLQDDDVCNTLFTLACACGCISMLHILIEQKKVKERYPELAQYSLDVLKTVKEIPAGTMSGTDLVQLYFLAAISADCEKKLDYLSASGFDLYVKNASGKTVIDRLEERIKENKYSKNRRGSLMQIEDKRAQKRLEEWYEQQEQREKIEMILKMLSLNEKEIFEDYFMCEKSAREIQQANGGTLEGIRAAIRRIRKKARLVEQGKNYFILCILGTLLIIRQIIK